MNKKEHNKKQKLLETMKLPLDACMGELRVTLTGGKEAFIENYKGILEYTDKTVFLQGRNNQVRFTGNRLSIDYYTNEDMKISGSIEDIHFS